jgi:hypothetical protein
MVGKVESAGVVEWTRGPISASSSSSATASVGSEKVMPSELVAAGEAGALRSGTAPAPHPTPLQGRFGQV